MKNLEHHPTLFGDLSRFLGVSATLIISAFSERQRGRLDPRKLTFSEL